MTSFHVLSNHQADNKSFIRIVYLQHTTGLYLRSKRNQRMLIIDFCLGGNKSASAQNIGSNQQSFIDSGIYVWREIFVAFGFYPRTINMSRDRYKQTQNAILSNWEVHYFADNVILRRNFHFISYFYFFYAICEWVRRTLLANCEGSVSNCEGSVLRYQLNKEKNRWLHILTKYINLLCFSRD